MSSPSSLENPSTTTTSETTPTSTTATGVSASPTRLQAAVARRAAAASSSSSSPPPSVSPEEIERLWEEDHGVLLSAVEALIASSSSSSAAAPTPAAAAAPAAPAAAAAPAAPAAAAALPPTTPSADGKGRRRPRPPSSEPTPPPPAAAPRGTAAAAAEEEDESDDLSLPVALWLRRHEPLLREAAAASAEARTFDTEAALLSLCSREGISPEKLAEECSKLSSDSSSDGEKTEGGRNSHPLGVDVAVALDRAADLRRALANFDEDALGDAPGFVTAADEETLRVRYRHVKGTREHTVRFEATIKAPLEHLLALCSEIDLSPGWNRFVVDDAAVVARARAEFCSFYYAAQWSPRPFPQMDSCVRVRGHDAYDSSARGAVISLESWPPAGDDDDTNDNNCTTTTKNCEPVSLRLPAAAARRHRVLVLPGSCIVLSPIRPCPVTGAKRTRGTLLVTLDPRLPFVPSFLVAWVLRVLAPAIKRGIDAVMASWFIEPAEEEEAGAAGEKRGRNSSAASGGEHGAEMRRRLKGRPELYELAKRLVARHAAERGGELPASPPRLLAPRASGSGILRRSSSEIPAAAGSPRRRSSSSSFAAAASAAVPASVSAVVDGAIARLARMSGGGGGGGGGEVMAAAATTTTTTAAAATTEQLPSSSPSSDEGWISWLARPLSATANYASSLLFVEQRSTS